jgi:hypothetical protein
MAATHMAAVARQFAACRLPCSVRCATTAAVVSRMAQSVWELLLHVRTALVFVVFDHTF